MFPTTQKCETISYGEKAEKHRLRLAKWEMEKNNKEIKGNLGSQRVWWRVERRFDFNDFATTTKTY